MAVTAVKGLNSHEAGYRYFEDSSTVDLDLFSCEKVVYSPSKREKNNNYVKKNMEIFKYVANIKSLDKYLPQVLRP